MSVLILGKYAFPKGKKFQDQVANNCKATSDKRIDSLTFKSLVLVQIIQKNKKNFVICLLIFSTLIFLNV